MTLSGYPGNEAHCNVFKRQPLPSWLLCPQGEVDLQGSELSWAPSGSRSPSSFSSWVRLFLTSVCQKREGGAQRRPPCAPPSLQPLLPNDFFRCRPPLHLPPPPNARYSRSQAKQCTGKGRQFRNLSPEFQFCGFRLCSGGILGKTLSLFGFQSPHPESENNF